MVFVPENSNGRDARDAHGTFSKLSFRIPGFGFRASDFGPFYTVIPLSASACCWAFMASHSSRVNIASRACEPL